MRATAPQFSPRTRFKAIFDELSYLSPDKEKRLTESFNYESLPQDFRGTTYTLAALLALVVDRKDNFGDQMDVAEMAARVLQSPHEKGNVHAIGLWLSHALPPNIAVLRQNRDSERWKQVMAVFIEAFEGLDSKKQAQALSHAHDNALRKLETQWDKSSSEWALKTVPAIRAVFNSVAGHDFPLPFVSLPFYAHLIELSLEHVERHGLDMTQCELMLSPWEGGWSDEQKVIHRNILSTLLELPLIVEEDANSQTINADSLQHARILRSVLALRIAHSMTLTGGLNSLATLSSEEFATLRQQADLLPVIQSHYPFGERSSLQPLMQKFTHTTRWLASAMQEWELDQVVPASASPSRSPRL